MNRNNLYILLRIILVLVAIVTGILLIIYLGKLMIPFIIGFFLSLVIHPLVDWIQIRTKMPRGFAVLTAIIIILAVISTAITLLVTEIIQGFSHLSKIVPEHYKKFTIYAENVYESSIAPTIQNLLSIFKDLDQGPRNTLLDSMQFLGEKLTDAFSTIMQALGNGLYLIITKLPNMATVLIISLLATFFISKDWERIIIQMKDKIPESV